MTFKTYFHKSLVLIPLLLAGTAVIAQPAKKSVEVSNTAFVEVQVKDSKQKPRKGEEVIFTANNSNKRYNGRTNEKGVLKLRLPVGSEYAVRIKALADSSQYGAIDIPSLKEGESYTAPFTIEIMYEPPQSFTLDNVHFDVNKATLRPDSYKELNELAEYMKWRENEKIEIAGHTDNVGKDADNLVLSGKRANTVKEYLVKKGIAATRIVAKGYGATEPVADNSDEQGRQKNRRTEVRILD